MKRRPVPYMSRHGPSWAHRETIRQVGGELVWKPEWGRVEFPRDGDIVQILLDKGITAKEIALVAPTWVFLRLAKEGYTLYEFANWEQAVAERVYLCKGVWIYRPNKDPEFVQCPVALKDLTPDPMDEKRERNA